MLIGAFSSTDKKMSSQLNSFTTVFDGSNYMQWAKQMQAFLMSQGLWGYAEGTIDKPLFPTPVDKDGKPEKVSDEEKAKYEELHAPWKRSQDMAQGSIMLCLTPSIQQNLSYVTTAEALWDALKDAYDVTNVPTIYKDFKEFFSFRINPNQHPAPQFDRLSAALGRLLRFFSSCPTTRRYIGLPSFLSPPSSHRASVLLRSNLADAILSCCLLSCTILIWCCDTISHVRYISTSHSYDY